MAVSEPRSRGIVNWIEYSNGLVLSRNILFAILFLVLVGANAAAWQGNKEYAGELSGFDQSEAANIDDDQPISANKDVLMRLLYRAKKSSPAQFRDYQQFTESISLEDVRKSPKQYRGWVFRLSGTARRLASVAVPAVSEDAIAKYSLVELELPDRTRIQVATLNVPSAWNQVAQLSEPVEFSGFFALHSGTDWPTAQPQVLMFAAPRIAWHPHELSDALSVGIGQLQLAQAGFDVGLLDICRRQNFKPFGAEEGEAFYNMLGAVNRVAASNEVAATGSATKFLDLVTEPSKHFGDLVQLEGHVKRIGPVSVDKQFQQEVGREFYQIDMFVALGGNSQIVVGPDKNQLVFRNRFPVTIHVGSLGRPMKDFERAKIQVEGHFYRLWNYQSNFSEEQGAESGQFSPLIMATKIEIVPPSEASGIGWLSILVLVFVLLLIVSVVLFTRTRKPTPSPPNIKIELPT